MYKLPLQSKKFIGFILVSILFFALLVLSMIMFPMTIYLIWFLIITVIVQGSLSIGYIISQAALDRFLSTVDKARIQEISQDE